MATLHAYRRLHLFLAWEKGECYDPEGRNPPSRSLSARLLESGCRALRQHSSSTALLMPSGCEYAHGADALCHKTISLSSLSKVRPSRSVPCTIWQTKKSNASFGWRIIRSCMIFVRFNIQSDRNRKSPGWACSLQDPWRHPSGRRCRPYRHYTCTMSLASPMM